MEGIYRNGQLQLLESVPPDTEGRVIVTFLGQSGRVDLADHHIDEDQAADLRHRLKAVADDWDRSEMDAYDAI